MRNRKSHSCTECRRRKKQCDRNVPRCNQCVLRGTSDICRWGDERDNQVRTSMNEHTMHFSDLTRISNGSGLGMQGQRMSESHAKSFDAYNSGSSDRQESYKRRKDRHSWIRDNSSSIAISRDERTVSCISVMVSDFSSIITGDDGRARQSRYRLWR